MGIGKVFIVGAGPGDPDLITVRAQELIKKADVIVYDRLLSPEVLERRKEGAELIYVGKTSSTHYVKQKRINRILVEGALKGKLVVRLKGGDPVLFGRGAEEALELRRNNIPFEFVPGVTSTLAAPLYAGIPLTFREIASSVALVTGHEDEVKAVKKVRLAELARAADSMVILMGMGRLREIVQELREGGTSLSTPIAIIADGTTPRQKVVYGSLKDIVKKAEEEHVGPPATIVVGDVVKLKGKLDWYRPMKRPVVAITRPLREAKALAKRLKVLGMEPFVAPTIEVRGLKVKGLKTYLEGLKEGRYEYVVFPSANGVAFLFEQARNFLPEDRLALFLNRCNVHPIGSGTAEELRRRGVKNITLPVTYSSKGMVRGLSKEKLKGKKILLPRAQGAGPYLAERLRALGAMVDELYLYEVALPKHVDRAVELVHRIVDGSVDAIMFTSPSTATNLLEVAKRTGMKEEMIRAINRCIVVPIGPMTNEALKKAGVRASIVPKEHTVEGLINALREKLGAPAL